MLDSASNPIFVQRRVTIYESNPLIVVVIWCHSSVRSTGIVGRNERRNYKTLSRDFWGGALVKWYVVVRGIFDPSLRKMFVEVISYVSGPGVNVILQLWHQSKGENIRKIIPMRRFTKFKNTKAFPTANAVILFN
ncbi:hypothetical protein TNCV_4887721 [Trichonephila clavipes]|nr:hypothetical protein TNCV_4887721 [Trichonephila clavipes]